MESDTEWRYRPRTAVRTDTEHHKYEFWEIGETMRIEDINILAACSEPFQVTPDRPVQCSELLRLPAELQNAIIRNVDRSDFNALMQTCVSLRAVVTPMILHHIVLSGFSPRLSLVVSTLEETMSKSKQAANIVRHLQLLGDDTLSDILSRLLPLTTHLRSLEYGCVVCEGPADNDFINMQALNTALAFLGNSLTSLKITYILDMNECDAGGRPCVEGWLCVKGMTALRKLETTFTILFGPHQNGLEISHNSSLLSEGAPELSDILPPGLEELKILPDPWEYDPARWSLERKVQVIADYILDGNWRRFTPHLRLLNYDVFDWRHGRTIPIEAAEAEESLAALVCKNGLEWALELPEASQITNIFFEHPYSRGEDSKARYF